MSSSVATIAVSLPLPVVAAEATTTPNVGQLAVSLPLPVVAMDASAPTSGGELAVSLPLPVVAAKAKHAQPATLIISLPMLSVSASVRVRGRVVSITGKVRAGGSAILAFLGPPDRSVEWGLSEGGGLLLPITDYTDQYGRAMAKYDTGGFEGDVVIQVEYGA